MRELFTSESVTEGHPDKVCDQISDAILDECLKQDPESHVAVETAVKNGLVWVFGEITTNAFVDVDKVVRKTLKDIGYVRSDQGIEYENCGIISSIVPQSKDIAQGVNKKDQGAGDQGMMFGFACNETKELMPLPIILAHKLTKRLATVRKKGILPYLGPDGKAQVTVEYKNNKPFRIEAVVVSNQHRKNIKQAKIYKDIKKHVINPICKKLMDKNTKIYVNPTGAFIIGGPQGDAGLTGRKIIVDTYGGMGRHGGGAFSGKDPSKVDRSAAYACRYIAKNIVASGIAERFEVQLSYAIGVAEPVGIWINAYNTNKLKEETIVKLIKKYFPLKPADIIKELKLKRPIYKKTAAYGHFGRNDPDFTWEKTDKAEILKKEMNKILKNGSK